MIKVNVDLHSGLISKMTISGHANQADIGQDLVCAGVSSIAIGLLNACDILASDCFELSMQETIKIVVIKNSEVVQTILKTGLIQLETVVEQYSEFIEIVKREV